MEDPESEVLEINMFDNPETRVYKEAANLQTPVKYIVEKDGEYTSITEILGESLYNYYYSHDPSEIFEEARDFSDRDIKNIYTEHLLSWIGVGVGTGEPPIPHTTPFIGKRDLYREFKKDISVCQKHEYKDIQFDETLTGEDLYSHAYYASDLIGEWKDKFDGSATPEQIAYFIAREQVLVLVNCLFPDSPFTTFNDLFGNYMSWYEDFFALLEKDVKRADEISRGQSTLIENLKDPRILTSKFSVSETYYTYTPKLKNGTIITPDDGLYILDSCVPNLYVPYIKYVDPTGNGYHRVYNGDKINTSYVPNYSKTIPELTKNDTPNTLYFNIWTGDISKDSYYKSKDVLFTLISYSLNQGSISIKSQESQYQRIVEILQTTIPILDFGIGVENKISGQIDFLGKNASSDPLAGLSSLALQRQKSLSSLRLSLGVSQQNSTSIRESGVAGMNFVVIKYDEMSFLDMVLNDSFVSQYLYVDERVSAIPKRKVTFNYKYPGANNETFDISFQISEEKYPSEKRIKVVDYYTEFLETPERKIQEGLSYLSITASNIRSREAVNAFLATLQGIFNHI